MDQYRVLIPCSEDSKWRFLNQTLDSFPIVYQGLLQFISGKCKNKISINKRC